jgi:hypothetical protein
MTFSLSAGTESSAPFFSASTTSATDWTERLSAEAAWTTVEIAFPISCGCSVLEVARRLGMRQAWVRARLDELRAEVERSD